MFTIRRAVPSDAALLGTIGPAAYAESYGDWWQTLAAYYAFLSTFSTQAFMTMLAQPEIRVWIAEADHGPAGFLTMRLGVADPVTDQLGGAEIPKFYLLGLSRGMGIGRALIDVAIAEAQSEGATYLWLEAMAEASWARRAYEEWGFAKIGAVALDNGLKPDRAIKLIMRRTLP